MKFLGYIPNSIPYDRVSVPLRGMWFEILALQTLAVTGLKMAFAAGRAGAAVFLLPFRRKVSSRLAVSGAGGISRC